jgi:hypothetical protein
MAKTLAAEQSFRARLAELGAELLETRWLGSGVPHRVRCAAGHECRPRPNNVQQRGTICQPCTIANRMPLEGSAKAEVNFRARLLKIGATLLEPKWLGNGTPHRVRCAAGHEYKLWPTTTRRGQGTCKKCTGRDPAEAEARFRARLAELGAELLEPYRNARVPHRARCAAGHDWMAWPSVVQLGKGCRTCAGFSLIAGEAAARARLAEHGAALLEAVWLGARTPQQIRWPCGHITRALPTNVRAGKGGCIVCADRDPKTSEAKFLARLARQGAISLEPVWLGADAPHRIQCVVGHITSPRPGHVNGGTGACRYCAGKTWDAFYVVTDTENHRLKFGITSGDPRPRLAQHRTDDYRTVERLLTDLPGAVAPDLERSVMAALQLAGEQPIRGREYYDISTLALVLDIVDGYLKVTTNA